MDHKLESIAGTLQNALDEARDTERIPVAAPVVARPQPTRSFIHFDRARYAEANRYVVDLPYEDYIALRIDGGPSNVVIEWDRLIGQVSPCLKVYDDGWALLHSMPDVIALLATLDGQNVQPLKLCKLLEGLGFVDAEPTVNLNESEGE